ncbi:MAG: YvcK family protein [Desulfobulbaceae bacterium]|nr:YvcK family protein [Desulfobulbaceae bacterium]
MIERKFQQISQVELTPLDLLPQDELREKIVDLVLNGIPPCFHRGVKLHLADFQRHILETSVENVRVVVFGGGTGLSNIIGGDSRREGWKKNPFSGLKRVFPQTKSVVCVTDNGGSTGELLKDLDLIAIGDIRHVLLSSIQLARLQKKYSFDLIEAEAITADLAEIFNWRFTGPLTSAHPEWGAISDLIAKLPSPLESYFQYLVDFLFTDNRLCKTLQRSHCFGNLLLAAAIYREKRQLIDGLSSASSELVMHHAILKGLSGLAEAIGAGKRAVMPCTSTPAQLRVLYANGVEISGEHKLSSTQRGVPVDSTRVDYCGIARVHDEVLKDIAEADIIIFAPGSLYSSIIPVFKVPGLAEAVRQNKNALKLLISNLWVQAGETDLSNADPERKFHVSDMLQAYEENIPGGTRDLFREILCVSLKEIPASILQSYAVEGKIPIYLDKDNLIARNFLPVECDIYSKTAIDNRGVIQHDAASLAEAIKGLYNGRSCFDGKKESEDVTAIDSPVAVALAGAGASTNQNCIKPFKKYHLIKARLDVLRVATFGTEEKIEIAAFKDKLIDIIWDNPVLPLDHLEYFKDIHLISPTLWNRDQKWDNVFSYFDPVDGCIKLRADQLQVRGQLEVALMIALGESLLGDYARQKTMEKIVVDGLILGRVYHLHLKPTNERRCFLSQEQLKTFLLLSRMCPTDEDDHYTRLINKGEGFTPPGLLMGLMYAWYVDNRLATHIEYKMSVLKINRSDLIPEQLRMAERRRKMIDFFREVVFVDD